MRFSIKKVLVLLALVYLVILLIYLARSSGDTTNNEDVGKLTSRGLPKKPIFKEDGGLGNFEPPTGAARRSGPGENGQAHRLRPDQEPERQRLTSEFFLQYAGQNKF